MFLTLAEFSKFPSYKRAVGMGQALAEMGDQVFVAALDCEENRLRLMKEAPACKSVWITTRNPFFEAWQKMKAVREIRPDVLFSSSYSLRNLAFLRMLLPRKMRSVIEFCELYSVYPRPSLKWKLKERFACIENSHVLCASKYLEAHFVREVESLRLTRTVFYAPYAYPEYLSSERRVPQKGKTILFMASLWRGYGVFDVMTAFMRVRESNPDVALEIIGNGPERENVAKWIGAYNAKRFIHLRGYVREDALNEIFSKADVFIAPMHNTVQDVARCPSKLYYYIPYNKPIVTCNLGDPLEALGNYGFYYEPDNLDDMTRVLGLALDKCDSFSFPKALIERHSWRARAIDFRARTGMAG